MVAEPQLCIDILQQLAAVDAAVDRVRRNFPLSRQPLRSRCIRLEETTRHARIAELSDIVDQFCK